MKFLISTFFILSIVVSNAQTEQINSTKETTAEIECSQTVKGEIRDKKTNNLLGDAIVTLSDTSGNLITQMVKEDATFSFKINCKTDYKIEAKKVDYTLESKDFKTSDDVDKELKLIILLDKGTIDFVTKAVVEKAEEKIEEVKSEKLSEALPEEIGLSRTSPNINPIYFDLASSYLNKEAKIELKKLAILMKKYPKITIEITAHSDAQGSDKINHWFAARRAIRTVDYMVRQGIDSKRITGKGFGATQLINRCAREIDCTEEEHARNRRSEFVIVSM